MAQLTKYPENLGLFEGYHRLLWHYKCSRFCRSDTHLDWELMSTHHTVRLQSASLLLFFVFCQVIGTMCVIPDVAIAADVAVLVEGGMTCPMDATTMCPPSLTSTPERESKNAATILHFLTPLVLNPLVASTLPSLSTLGHWSSVLPSVPLSIVASSVLRI